MEEEKMEVFTDVVEKKGPKGLICAILVILLLGLIGFGYYYKNKPEVVFKTALNKAFKLAKNNVQEDKAQVDFDFKFNLSSNMDELKEVEDLFNNLKFRGSIYEDLSNKVYNLNVKADYRNSEVINLGAYYENEKAYLNLNDLFDKLIYADVKLSELSIDITDEDIKVLLDETHNALMKSLEKCNISKEKVDLDGSKATKNVILINDKNIGEVVNAYINYVKGSDKYVNVLAKVSGLKVEEIKELLNENIEVPELGTTIEIALYTRGLLGNVVKFSVNVAGMELISVTNTAKNTYEMKMGAMGYEVKVVAKEESKDKMSVVLSTEIEGVKFGYTMNISVNRNAKLEKPDTSKAISYEELTEEDLEKIETNLTKKDGLQDLIELFESMFSIEEDYKLEVVE